MVKYKLKPASAAILSSALVLSSLTGLATTADAATKVKNVTSSAKIKKGKLVKKSDGKIIKGYASYKSVIYKDGKKFKGLLNKRYYNNGKKATGLYKSKYYKNGSLGTGTYKNNYYKKGSLFTGKLKGVYYQKGKVFTGVTSKGNYYKKGKLGTGSYKGIYYSVGKKLTGLTSKGVYYKNGKLGNGVYKDVLYKSGKPFNGTLKDEVYVNGKVDANKTANLVFSTAKDAFTSNEDAFKTSKKQVEDLTSLAKKAGVTPAKAASLQVKSAKEIQDFIAKYSSTDFKTLSATELDAFKAELSKFTAEATTNLEAVSKLVNDSTMSLLSAISAMKSFATEEQKAEFTKLTTQANIVIHALKAAGVDTSKLEDALKQTDIKVPEIETPGTDGGTETPGTGTETPGTGGGNNGGGGNTGGNGGGGNIGGGNTGGGNTGGGTVTETPEEVAKKAAESAVKALETNPTQEKIQTAQDAVKALTDLKSDYDVKTFESALTKASDLLKKEIAELEKGIQDDGSLAVKGENVNFDDVFTFQMAGIALVKESEKVTAFDRNATDNTLKESKTLTTAQMNEGILATLERINADKLVTLDKKNPPLNIESSQKHGYTVFTVTANNFSKEIFDKLDGNKNNAYLITVNNKVAEGISTKAYKILFQVIDDNVEAKFVESTVNDDKFSIDAATDAVNALFSDENKTVLADSVVQNTIVEATKLVEKITNAQIKNNLTADLTKASELLEKEITDLKKGIQDNGSLAVEGTFEEFKTNYTFQMKSIYLNNGAPTHFVEGKAQAKDLTIEQINKGIQATINAKNFDTSKSENNYVQINSEEKYGYTILTVDTSKLSDEVFKKLDGDSNKTYNITVNKKENNLYTKTYKILLENTNNEIKGKFIDHPAKK